MTVPGEGNSDGDAQATTRWELLRALDGPKAESAWRDFMGRYRPFVQSILQRILQRADHVRAAEEEFWGYIFLSGAVQRADTGRRFRPYLSGIVNHFAQAWLRKHATKDHETVSRLAAAPSSPEAQLQELAQWSANVLALALAALAAESPAAALAVRSFYGMSARPSDDPPMPQTAASVATLLGCTLANAYQLLSRGRRRLRSLVEAELMRGCASPADLDEELQQFLLHVGERHPGLLDTE